MFSISFAEEARQSPRSSLLLLLLRLALAGTPLFSVLLRTSPPPSFRRLSSLRLSSDEEVRQRERPGLPANQKEFGEREEEKTERQKKREECSKTKRSFGDASDGFASRLGGHPSESEEEKKTEPTENEKRVERRREEELEEDRPGVEEENSRADLKKLHGLIRLVREVRHLLGSCGALDEKKLRSSSSSLGRNDVRENEGEGKRGGGEEEEEAEEGGEEELCRKETQGEEGRDDLKEEEEERGREGDEGAGEERREKKERSREERRRKELGAEEGKEKCAEQERSKSRGEEERRRKEKEEEEEEREEREEERRESGEKEKQKKPGGEEKKKKKNGEERGEAAQEARRGNAERGGEREREEVREEEEEEGGGRERKERERKSVTSVPLSRTAKSRLYRMSEEERGLEGRRRRRLGERRRRGLDCSRGPATSSSSLFRERCFSESKRNESLWRREDSRSLSGGRVERKQEEQNEGREEEKEKRRQTGIKAYQVWSVYTLTGCLRPIPPLSVLFISSPTCIRDSPSPFASSSPPAPPLSPPSSSLLRKSASTSSSSSSSLAPPFLPRAGVSCLEENAASLHIPDRCSCLVSLDCLLAHEDRLSVGRRRDRLLRSRGRRAACCRSRCVSSLSSPEEEDEGLSKKSNSAVSSRRYGRGEESEEEKEGKKTPQEEEGAGGGDDDEEQGLPRTRAPSRGEREEERRQCEATQGSSSMQRRKTEGGKSGASPHKARLQRNGEEDQHKEEEEDGREVCHSSPSSPRVSLPNRTRPRHHDAGGQAAHSQRRCCGALRPLPLPSSSSSRAYQRASLSANAEAVLVGCLLYSQPHASLLFCDVSFVRALSDFLSSTSLSLHGTQQTSSSSSFSFSFSSLLGDKQTFRNRRAESDLKRTREIQRDEDEEEEKKKKSFFSFSAIPCSVANAFSTSHHILGSLLSSTPYRPVPASSSSSSSKPSSSPPIAVLPPSTGTAPSFPKRETKSKSPLGLIEKTSRRKSTDFNANCTFVFSSTVFPTSPSTLLPSLATLSSSSSGLRPFEAARRPHVLLTADRSVAKEGGSPRPEVDSRGLQGKKTFDSAFPPSGRQTGSVCMETDKAGPSKVAALSRRGQKKEQVSREEKGGDRITDTRDQREKKRGGVGLREQEVDEGLCWYSIFVRDWQYLPPQMTPTALSVQSLSSSLRSRYLLSSSGSSGGRRIERRLRFSVFKKRRRTEEEEKEVEGERKEKAGRDPSSTDCGDGAMEVQLTVREGLLQIDASSCVLMPISLSSTPLSVSSSSSSSSASSSTSLSSEEAPVSHPPSSSSSPSSSTLVHTGPSSSSSSTTCTASSLMLGRPLPSSPSAPRSKLKPSPHSPLSSQSSSSSASGESSPGSFSRSLLLSPLPLSSSSPLSRSSSSSSSSSPVKPLSRPSLPRPFSPHPPRPPPRGYSPLSCVSPSSTFSSSSPCCSLLLLSPLQSSSSSSLRILLGRVVYVSPLLRWSPSAELQGLTTETGKNGRSLQNKRGNRDDNAPSAVSSSSSSRLLRSKREKGGRLPSAVQRDKSTLFSVRLRDVVVFSCPSSSRDCSDRGAAAKKFSEKMSSLAHSSRRETSYPLSAGRRKDHGDVCLSSPQGRGRRLSSSRVVLPCGPTSSSSSSASSASLHFSLSSRQNGDISLKRKEKRDRSSHEEAQKKKKRKNGDDEVLVCFQGVETARFFHVFAVGRVALIVGVKKSSYLPSEREEEEFAKEKREGRGKPVSGSLRSKGGVDAERRELTSRGEDVGAAKSERRRERGQEEGEEAQQAQKAPEETEKDVSGGGEAEMKVEREEGRGLGVDTKTGESKKREAAVLETRKKKEGRICGSGCEEKEGKGEREKEEDVDRKRRKKKRKETGPCSPSTPASTEETSKESLLLSRQRIALYLGMTTTECFTWNPTEKIFPRVPRSCPSSHERSSQGVCSSLHGPGRSPHPGLDGRQRRNERPLPDAAGDSSSSSPQTTTARLSSDSEVSFASTDKPGDGVFSSPCSSWSSPSFSSSSSSFPQTFPADGGRRGGVYDIFESFGRLQAFYRTFLKEKRRKRETGRPFSATALSSSSTETPVVTPACVSSRSSSLPRPLRFFESSTLSSFSSSFSVLGRLLFLDFFSSEETSSSFSSSPLSASPPSFISSSHPVAVRGEAGAVGSYLGSCTYTSAYGFLRLALFPYGTCDASESSPTAFLGPGADLQLDRQHLVSRYVGWSAFFIRWKLLSLVLMTERERRGRRRRREEEEKVRNTQEIAGIKERQEEQNRKGRSRKLGRGLHRDSCHGQAGGLQASWVEERKGEEAEEEREEDEEDELVVAGRGEEEKEGKMEDEKDKEKTEEESEKKKKKRRGEEKKKTNSDMDGDFDRKKETLDTRRESGGEKTRRDEIAEAFTGTTEEEEDAEGVEEEEKEEETREERRKGKRPMRAMERRHGAENEDRNECKGRRIDRLTNTFHRRRTEERGEQALPPPLSLTPYLPAALVSCGDSSVSLRRHLESSLLDYLSLPLPPLLLLPLSSLLCALLSIPFRVNLRRPPSSSFPWLKSSKEKEEKAVCVFS